MMPAIIYDDEAHESWMTAVDGLRGLVAELAFANGEAMEAVVEGAGTDDLGIPKVQFYEFDEQAPDLRTGPLRSVGCEQVLSITIF